MLLRGTPPRLHLTGPASPTLRMTMAARSPTSCMQRGTRTGPGPRRLPIAGSAAGKNPQLKITDTGVYIAHGDGFLYESQRFTWKPAGKNWTSVTVDRGWGETGTSSITGLTGVSPSFTMGPDGNATIIYEDAMNQTLMMARGPLANDSFETSVLMDARGKIMDGWYPVLVSKDRSGRGGGHLVFADSRKSALSYAEISADPAILPVKEIVDSHATTCTITSDSAGKPHIFYLDGMFGRIKHAWLA